MPRTGISSGTTRSIIERRVPGLYLFYLKHGGDRWWKIKTLPNADRFLQKNFIVTSTILWEKVATKDPVAIRRQRKPVAKLLREMRGTSFCVTLCKST